MPLARWLCYRKIESQLINHIAVELPVPSLPYEAMEGSLAREEKNFTPCMCGLHAPFSNLR